MQVSFTVNVGRHLGTQAGVHLIEGVCIIWGPFTGNTGFTVYFIVILHSMLQSCFLWS